MSRIFFFLFLFFAVFGLILWNRRKSAELAARERRLERRERGADSGAPIAMRRCPQCGCMFPENEAVLGDGVAYCSERCRSIARSRR